jgi:choline dehydrogenase
VVVGAGSAGAAAARLSAGPGRRVVLLEAGGRATAPGIRVPAACSTPFERRAITLLLRP